MERLTEQCKEGIWVKESPANNKTLFCHYYEGYYALKRLSDYEDLGYTPDEIKLVMNPPEEIWLIDGWDNDREEPIYPVFPVGGEQLILCDGFLFNCQDEFGDYQEVPVAGLGTEYFITIEEAIEKLKENDND